VLCRGNDRKPSNAGIQPSSTSPPDTLHWSAPESSQPITQADGSWEADCNPYFLNNDFDQTSEFWRRNNSLQWTAMSPGHHIQLEGLEKTSYQRVHPSKLR
jgi:hypothetical protein